MRIRLLELADRVAHVLYEPAMLGKPCVAIPPRRAWLHRIHLIPGPVFAAVCDRYEAAITGETT